MYLNLIFLAASIFSSSFRVLPLSSGFPISHNHKRNSSSHIMLPTFHMNSFKPWTPHPTKPFLPQKTPHAYNPRSASPLRPKPSRDSPPSTLPLPKHHLPARPPAEVCVLVGANTPPLTPSGSSSPHLQTRETLRPDSASKTFSEEPHRGAGGSTQFDASYPGSRSGSGSDSPLCSSRQCWYFN